MKVFVAGAGGVAGRPLVTLLTARGHDVVATSRSPERLGALRAAGAETVALDVLDREAAIAAVAAVAPDVIIHQATALAGATNLRNFDRAFTQTNLLRTEGTANLVAAARAAGVRRLVAQSYGGWPYAREGGPVKTEDAPLDPEPPRHQRRTLAAIRRLEELVTRSDGLDGVALRYGSFYGPRTSLSPGGELTELVRRRRLPIIGDGAGVWSFLHVEDAASATVAAVESQANGIFNVADDEPAPMATWLPELARILDAPPPRRVPVWIGRLAGGDAVTSMATRTRGIDSSRARRELGWKPVWASWREGFRAAVATPERRLVSSG